ncbi:ABC-2 type transport system ATP-binding protein [Reichenbachiella faecimaris]|uniref:ABC-2 type transport system ATP-binding protein n=1 Tax=Reichenbachiella faecimaris TaxID=692418 RepID=A0A1W2G7W3_REIFA|nr:ATP-binding cassette domain-containing protein [Reichenbachiella faecimaris]SMD32418.1 ABC-2 type transport system ATP-binding protein [Reichenbachiella faecimaris]
MKYILETKGLTKKYGKLTALDQLNLTIEPGMVFGLLGPNGSGKTTTLGMILEVTKPSSGSYLWFDEAPSANSRKKIGAILETPCFYPYLSAVRNLRIIAKIKECRESRIEEVLRQVGLYERKDDPFKNYSLGMKQRLAIASALLADPPVLILDEPTNGLDPQGIVEIREVIQQIASSGKTIILASHLLDEVQKVCTHFCVLRKGQKLYQGSVDEALSDQKTIEVAASNLDHLEATLKKMNGIYKVEKLTDVISLTTENGLSTESINAFLFEKGLTATHLVKKSGSLEKQFLKILNEND